MHRLTGGKELKALQGLAGVLSGWDGMQVGALWSVGDESESPAGPIRQALRARVRGLDFLLSLLGSPWQA